MLSLSRVFLLSLPLMILTGFGAMIQMVSNNTILQTIVDDDKRGRVMSLFTVYNRLTAFFKQGTNASG
ncbi:MAG: hypothetical protein WC601_00840 [Desulfotomaculaceae bacterium]